MSRLRTISCTSFKERWKIVYGTLFKCKMLPKEIVLEITEMVIQLESLEVISDKYSEVINYYDFLITESTIWQDYVADIEVFYPGQTHRFTSILGIYTIDYLKRCIYHNLEEVPLDQFKFIAQYELMTTRDLSHLNIKKRIKIVYEYMQRVYDSLKARHRDLQYYYERIDKFGMNVESDLRRMDKEDEVPEPHLKDMIQ